MTGGVATILIGALTAIELAEKKDRYEDAVNAVRAMLNEGYIPGAGTPLMTISYNEYTLDLPLAQQTAFTAYLKALRKPAHKLISSSGKEPENIVPKILKDESMWKGFDAKNGNIVDLKSAGIIDPYKIVNNSVIYASNIAEQFMSLNAIITSDMKQLSIESLDEVLNNG